MKKIYFTFYLLPFAFCLYFPGHAHSYLKGELQAVIYGEEESSGSFNQPQSIYVDQDKGRIYVVDTLNNRIISYDENYKFVSQFDAEGKLNLPVSMLKDEKGRLLITNRGEGNVLVIHLKERTIKPIDFGKIFPRPVPSHMAMDENGRLYIIDEAYKRILIFSDDYKFIGEINEPQAAGFSDIKCVENRIYALDTLLKKVFVYNYEGDLISSREFKSLSFPVSMAVDKIGHTYILDAHEGKVYIFKDHEMIGEIGKKGWKEGRLYYPGHISIDNKNSLYVVDTGNNRVEIFKIK
jgi:sugar lactone lactonase YvrE